MHHRVPQSAAAAAAHFVTDLRQKKRAQPHVENEIIFCFPLLLKKNKKIKKSCDLAPAPAVTSAGELIQDFEEPEEEEEEAEVAKTARM